MKPEELEKASKTFCENVRLGYSKEYFVMGLSSGTEGSAFSFTPQHAKRLLQYLEHEISEFEKEHGTINAKWNPKIVSPVQKFNPPLETS
jgi:hypothetical protein